MELYATGKSMTAIAAILKVDVSTISRDIAHLREEAKAKHDAYIDNLPFEHQKSIASIDRAHSELWALYEKETDTRQKKALLDSIGEIIIKRQVLLGDPQQIDRALKLVASLKRRVKESDNLSESEGQQKEAEATAS
ncbi:hypothetical protein [Nitrososphaera sp.]|uniref:hypothetical protein n=1 Tax=Nitrososphaera sp. TaxID=1971748 RepID=UPI00307E3D21